MSYQRQTSSAALDMSKGIISMWVKPPAASLATNFLPIFEFGNTNDNFQHICILYLDSLGFEMDLWSIPIDASLTRVPGTQHYYRWDGTVFFGSLSPQALLPAVTSIIGNLTFADTAAETAAYSAQPASGPFKPFIDSMSSPPNDTLIGATVATWTPLAPFDPLKPGYNYIGTKNSLVVPGAIFADTWNHVLVSWDVSTLASVTSTGGSATSDITETLDSTNYLYVSVNGVDHSPRFMQIRDGEVKFPCDPGQILPMGGGSDASGNFYGPGHLNWVTTNTPATITVDPWMVSINGYECGWPATSDDVVDISQVHMAFVQVFNGTSINTTVPTNMAKFITFNSPSTIVPAPFPASLPGLVYGFQRNKRQSIPFSRNFGSAGAVEVIGNVADYFPGPGQ